MVEFQELEQGWKMDSYMGFRVLELRNGLGVLGFLLEFDVNRDTGHCKTSSESAKAGSGKTWWPREAGQGWVFLDAYRV